MPHLGVQRQYMPNSANSGVCEPPLGGDGVCQSPQALLWVVGPELVVVKYNLASKGVIGQIKGRIPILLTPTGGTQGSFSHTACHPLLQESPTYLAMSPSILPLLFEFLAVLLVMPRLK